MFGWIMKYLKPAEEPERLLDPRGPNKFEPQTRAPGTQYPAPKGENPYGTYQNPHKRGNE